MSEKSSYRFTHAIVRRPGRSVVDGLRAVDQGKPDAGLFQAEHRAYIRALQRAGVKITELPALEEFPDSVFIEDTALLLPEGSVILRPGAPSRAGEAEATARALSVNGREVCRIGGEGHIDGGDVLVTGPLVLVGLSERTDMGGFEATRDVLEVWGYSVQAVHTPEHVLHFKSDCSLLDDETILATSRISEENCFAQFRVLTVPEGEEAAANSVRVNGTVFVPAGFPATAALIARAGYKVEVLRISQAALLDGGLSCMSLRF